VDEADWIKAGLSKPEWEQVDHSVVCAGWGTENGVDYWIIQNTWGKDWGNGGYFRMKRGADVAGIESINVAVDPYMLVKDSYGNWVE